MGRDIERHDRIVLDPGRLEAWSRGLNSPLDPAICAWARRELPFIARRDETMRAAGTVSLGLQRPAKMRMAVSVPLSLIAQHQPALPLSQAFDAMPPAAAGPLRRLDTDASAMGCVLRVYGSCFWQAVSGENHVTERSDIDLLFHPAGEAQLDAMLRLLAACAVPLRLDGEAVFPGGWGVSWRELLSSQGNLLARHRAGIALVTRADLVARLVKAA